MKIIEDYQDHPVASIEGCRYDPLPLEFINLIGFKV